MNDTGAPVDNPPREFQHLQGSLHKTGRCRLSVCGFHLFHRWDTAWQEDTRGLKIFPP